MNDVDDYVACFRSKGDGFYCYSHGKMGVEWLAGCWKIIYSLDKNRNLKFILKGKKNVWNSLFDIDLLPSPILPPGTMGKIRRACTTFYIL